MKGLTDHNVWVIRNIFKAITIEKCVSLKFPLHNETSEYILFWPLQITMHKVSYIILVQTVIRKA